MLNPLVQQYGRQIAGSQSSIFTRLGYSFERIGLLDAIIPFLLIFTIVFAALEKSGLFGRGKRKINAVVAFAMALTVVVPHLTNRYPPGYDVVVIINSVIPQVVIVFVAIILFLVLIGIFGGEVKWGSGLSGLATIVSLIAIIVIFMRSIGTISQFPRWAVWLDNPDIQALVVIILVFGLIVGFVTKEPGGPGMAKNIWEGLKEITK